MTDEYLGDGVYVSFDGYHFILKANSYTVPTSIIALDPHVFNALVAYARKINSAMNEDKEEE